MNPRIHKQAGGTVLGLIIGLIIGLGIAVAVAITITKSPVPLSKRMALPETVTVDPDKPVDPNRPLYGKRAPVNNPPSAASPAGNAVPPVAAGQGAPENTAAPVQREIGTVPIIDKSIVTAAVRPAAPDGMSPARALEKQSNAGGANDKYTYYLQAGAFRDRTDADNTRAKLALLGFEARISERPSESGTLYRVRVGPIGQVETINRMRTQLTDSGVDAAVVRVAK